MGGLAVRGALMEAHLDHVWAEPKLGPASARLVNSMRPGERERPGTRTEADVTNKRLVVAVVDDSDSVRESLPDLLAHVGYAVQAFESAEAFLASGAASEASCLILDVALPGMSGPDLQQELKRRGIAIPVVFITAQGDKSLQPRLTAAGAVACLFKPFSDIALLEAVETAIRTRDA
jgi:FixJ family two-component response regulator